MSEHNEIITEEKAAEQLALLQELAKLLQLDWIRTSLEEHHRLYLPPGGIPMGSYKPSGFTGHTLSVMGAVAGRGTVRTDGTVYRAEVPGTGLTVTIDKQGELADWLARWALGYLRIPGAPDVPPE